MLPAELRLQAAQELGAESQSPRERALWIEERRGSIELLTSLADWNSDVLRRAALEVATEWTNPEVGQLAV